MKRAGMSGTGCSCPDTGGSGRGQPAPNADSGDPPPHRRLTKDVVGCWPYEFGRIAREPGTDTMMNIWNVERRRNNEMLHMKIKLETDLRRQRVVKEYEEITDPKMMYHKFREKVALGVKAAERAVDERRSRLRDMLLMEEMALTKEFVERSQNVRDQQFEDMQRRALEIRHRKEVERKELAEKKRIQQYTARCAGLREVQSSRINQEVRQAQLEQIAAKQAAVEREKAVERMWADVLRREVEAKVAREVEEAKIAFQKNKDIAEVWILQQKGKLAQDEERRRLRQQEQEENEQVMAQLALENRHLEEARIKHMEQVKRELGEQLEEHNAFVARQAEADKLLEDSMKRVAEAELERETNLMKDTRSTQKREVAAYLRDLQLLRQRREDDEAEFERVANQELAEINRQRDEVKLKAKEARLNLIKNVQKERQEQVEARRMAAVAEEARRRHEEEFSRLQHEQHVALQKEYDRRTAEFRRKYAEELTQQMEFNRALRRKEQEEADRMWIAGLLEEESYLRIIQHLLNDTTGTRKHPFLKLVEGEIPPE